jgi:hypothetical protein
MTERREEQLIEGRVHQFALHTRILLILESRNWMRGAVATMQRAILPFGLRLG